MCINNTSSSPLLYQMQSTEYKAIFAWAESTEQLSSKSEPRIREMPVFNAVDIAQVLPSLHISENITAINYLGNSVTIPSDELAAFLTENVTGVLGMRERTVETRVATCFAKNEGARWSERELVKGRG